MRHRVRGPLPLPEWAREGAMVPVADRIQRLPHVLSAAQFDRPLLEHLFERADALSAGPVPQAAAGKIMASLFYEPSTRTRLSFESAMLRLGGSVIGTEAAHIFSSSIKGETLEDTVRMVSAYADVIVLRHDQEGAAGRAAAVADVPLVNAGDGPGEHPTQSLLDLYTIGKELGRIDSVHVAMCGDLRHGRTVRSLTRLLLLFDQPRLTFVAPAVVQIGDDIKSELDAAGITYCVVNTLDDLESVDVVYQTRIQKERFTDAAEFLAAQAALRIDATFMRRLSKNAVILHPLPRVAEIATEVDADPRAAYFRQAGNGVAVRMALLEMLVS